MLNLNEKHENVYYGMDCDTNELKTIEEVESGLTCNVVCPFCNSKLVAKKGKKNRHHFTHYQSINCTGGAETSLHLRVKDIIKSNNSIVLPKLEVKETAYCKHDICNESRFYYNDVILENKDCSIIPDIMICKGNISIDIEVYVTHKVDEDKLNKIKDCNRNVIEIDVRWFYKNTYLEQELIDYVLNAIYPEKILKSSKTDLDRNSCRYWINNNHLNEIKDLYDSYCNNFFYSLYPYLNYTSFTSYDLFFNTASNKCIFSSCDSLFLELKEYFESHSILSLSSCGLMMLFPYMDYNKHVLLRSLSIEFSYYKVECTKHFDSYNNYFKFVLYSKKYKIAIIIGKGDSLKVDEDTIVFSHQYMKDNQMFYIPISHAFFGRQSFFNNFYLSTSSVLYDKIMLLEKYANIIKANTCNEQNKDNLDNFNVFIELNKNLNLNDFLDSYQLKDVFSRIRFGVGICPCCGNKTWLVKSKYNKAIINIFCKHCYKVLEDKYDSTPYRCPKCGDTMSRKKNYSNGEVFLGCNDYPICNHTENLSSLRKYYYISDTLFE